MILNKALKIVALITISYSHVCAKSYLGPTLFKNETVEDVSVVGPTTLTNVTTQSLNVTGPVTFTSLRVSDDAIITGPIKKSTDGHFSTLTVTGPSNLNTIHCTNLCITGPTTLTNAHVTGDTTLVGQLNATGCHFKKVTITADIMTLKDTQTGTIVVKKNNPGSNSGWFSWFFNFFGFNATRERSEIITLSGNTNVKGDITCEGGKAKVIIMPGATVTGKITGATIEKH